MRTRSVFNKSKAGDEIMPEGLFSTPENETEAAGMLKSILKPSHLVIVLIVFVLSILVGWYVFILKPALTESNYIDIPLEPSKQSSSYVPSVDAETEKAVVITSSSDFPPLKALSKAAANEQEVVPEKKKVVNSEKRTSQQQQVSSLEVVHEPVPKPRGSENSAIEKFKTLLPPTVQRDERVSAAAQRDKRVNTVVQRDKRVNTAEKVKSFASHWKKSFLTPATEPSCTQVQISMNQCQKN